MGDVPESYDGLPEAVASLDPGRVVALPDGSVDVHVHVRDAGHRVHERAAFGRRIADGERAFQFDPRETAPGGQAVTAARQAHALGADVHLYGHCDDSRFDFPFEVTSLGEPARVVVAEFDDDALMLAEASEDLTTCDADRLRSAGAFAERADAVCLANYATVPGVPGILRAFEDAPGDGPVVLDPGPVVGVGRDRARDLRDALETLGDARRVVVSTNEAETRAMASALGVEEDGALSTLGPLREACDVDAVVLHEKEHAVAATTDDRIWVPNLSVDEPVTSTGGGDRFSAAVACALAGGWEWRRALALGNACASYHVATGETADGSALESF